MLVLGVCGSESLYRQSLSHNVLGRLAMTAVRLAPAAQRFDALVAAALLRPACGGGLWLGHEPVRDLLMCI